MREIRARRAWNCGLLFLLCLLVPMAGISAVELPLVSDQNILTYRITQVVNQRASVVSAVKASVEVTLILRKEGRGFRLEEETTFGTSSVRGNGKLPLVLDAQLRPVEGDGIEAYFLGRLWLPPSERRTAWFRRTRRQRWDRWDVVAVTPNNRAVGGERFYDVKTGFLVGYNLLGQQAILVKSDIAGL
ncbi:MAG: hypothetical protein HY737_03305 [Candidatus Omnitrophica bacterium]|nr:hypothetical protein [Candidatus Omnitrophota bacterium]